MKKQNYSFLNYNRWKVIFTIFLLGLIIIPAASKAQTPLVGGDIAFLTYDADGTDRFTIVLLKDIAATTVINFTDNGFSSATAGRSGEGFLTFTAPTGGYTAGTVFTWTNGMTITGTPWNSNNPSNFALNASGDQIFAFQGTTANWVSQTSVTLIAGINTNGAFIASGTASASTSYAPSGLSSSFVTQIATENGYFANGTATQTSVTVSDTKSNLQALFFDGANKWYSNATGPLTIPTYSVTVSSGTPSIAISSGSPAAGNINQNSTDNIIGSIKLDVTVAAATLTGVTVTTAGTYTAADIQASGFKFWINSTNSLSGATQLGTSQAAAGPGNVAVSGLSTNIPLNNTRYILFTSSISSGATAGHTINITTTAFNNITFSAGTKTGTNPVAAGNSQTITALTPSIAISNGSPAAGNINQNSTNNILRSIKLDVTVTAATLTGVTVTTAGTYQTSDLQANGFKFWINTTNDLTGATQLGTSQAIVASGNNISVSGLSQSVPVGTRYILVTTDVAYDANTSRNISITSTAFSNITFSTGTKTGTDPVAGGNAQTFTAVTPGIAIAQVGPSTGNINIPATSAIIYELSFAVTSNTTNLNSITVTTGGTYQTGDLTASSFKLWYNTSNTFGTASQIGTSQAVVASGNNVTFSGLTQNIISGTTGYVWVTVDVSSGATTSRTINITSTPFSNITFSAGTKTGTNPAAAGGLQTFVGVPFLTEVIFPQYAINGNTAGDRIPMVCRLTLSNLNASSTYRYTVAASTDGGVTTSNAAGNMFAIYNTTQGSGGYIVGYTSGKSLNGTEFSNNEFTTSNRYATFTTDASGSYTGWFSVIPTGNAVFTAGNDVYFYVQMNNGSGGTAITQSLRSTNTIRMLDVSTAKSVMGTSSNASAEDMVFLYDNTSGSGRPLYGTWTENDGITTTFSTWYTGNVDGTATAWGAVIPSSNANGLKRIEFRSIDNTLDYALTDADGSWNGVNTVNPAAGYSSPLSISNTTVENLQITSDVVLSSNQTISGTLTLTSGIVTLGSNTLTVGSVTGGSATSYVKTNGTGGLKYASMPATTDVTFPVGNSTYNPVILNYTATTRDWTIVVNDAVTHGNVVSNPNAVVNREWNITPSDRTNITGATLTLQWNDADEGSSFIHTPGTSLVIAHFDSVAAANGGNGWYPYPADPASTGSVPGSHKTTVTGMTSFSPYAIANDGPLPVEMSSFTSSLTGRTVKLNWTTNSETNNSGFDIERKNHGSNEWSKLGNVTGAGNSSAAKNYIYSDRNLQTGIYDYRLKQIDLNGNYKYFELSTSVDLTVPKVFSISQNYPNPFNPMTKINYDLPVDTKVNISVFDITGKLINELVNSEQTAGYYTVMFDGSKLASGIYFYSIRTADFISTKRMLLVK